MNGSTFVMPDVVPDQMALQQQAKREPRAIAVEARFIVRNVQAGSFDEAKDIASLNVPQNARRRFKLSAFAAREADGSYTVEFR